MSLCQSQFLLLRCCAVPVVFPELHGPWGALETQQLKLLLYKQREEKKQEEKKFCAGCLLKISRSFLPLILCLVIIVQKLSGITHSWEYRKCGACYGGRGPAKHPIIWKKGIESLTCLSWSGGKPFLEASRRDLLPLLPLARTGSYACGTIAG